MESAQYDIGTDTLFGSFQQAVENYRFSLAPREIGSVISVSSGIARVSGLSSAGFEELLKFPGNLYGIAYNIDPGEIGVILLGNDALVHAGDAVERTGRVMDIPVGNTL